MDGTFSLPYSEYRVAETLIKLFPKKEGYALFIPVSRQQKGIDLLLYNQKSGKKLAIQVKASRAYPHDPEKSERQYGIWFKNFFDKCKTDNADYYIIYGLYPMHKKTVSSKDCWKEILLLYSKAQMIKYLDRVRLVNSPNERDSFFGFEFDDGGPVWEGRGIEKKKCKEVTRYLFPANGKKKSGGTGNDVIEEMKGKLNK